MVEENAVQFSPEELLYYLYLKRRRKAGEVGSRMTMGDVVVAHNKLRALLGDGMTISEEGDVSSVKSTAGPLQVEMTEEMQALCDLLYVEISSEQGGEDAP